MAVQWFNLLYIVRTYATAGSMIQCIHVLFQPIFATIILKLTYHGSVRPRYMFFDCSAQKCEHILDDSFISLVFLLCVCYLRDLKIKLYMN